MSRMGRNIARSGWGGVLSLFLALLLSVQMATSFLPAAGQGGGLALVLCTGDGESTVALAPDDQSTPEAPAKGHCPFCVVSATFLPGFSDPGAPTSLVLAPRFVAEPASQISGRLNGRPDAIRAPPAIV